MKKKLIESALFVAGKSLTLEELAEIVKDKPEKLRKILEEMNRDAIFVFRLMISSLTMQGTKPCHTKRGVRKLLTNELDWTGKRVTQSFENIKNALTTYKEVRR